MTKTTTVYGSVVLTGSTDNLDAAKSSLASRYQCYHYRDNAMLVADIAAHELGEIERAAKDNNVRVEQIRDARTVTAEEEPVEQPKQPNMDLIAGGWYKTNADELPLIHVIAARNEVRPDGIQVWLFDVDFVAADALPKPATLSVEQLKSYNPKPASLDDFDRLDIIPPDGFEPTPHAIPSVDDDQEEFADKTEDISGVSLPQAQAAVQQLQQMPGLRSAEVDIVQIAPGAGFYLRAKPLRRFASLPTKVAGTAVLYR